MPDSRTLQPSMQERPVYVTSFQPSGDEYVWIQAPISEQPFEHPAESYIKGIYVQIGEAVSIAPQVEPNANTDFAAWEAASDEALLNFENNLE